MRGIVIAFPGKWAGASIKAERTSPKRPLEIKARVDRIALLLAELENLALPFAEGTAALSRARETLRRIEEKLAMCSSACPAPATAGEDRDSQPHVDSEVLERHFRPFHR